MSRDSSSNSKRFWLILVGVAIVLGAIFKLTNDGSSTPSSNSTQPTNHVEGEGKAGVTLVEYGDYECPYCEEYYPVVKQVAETYNTQIFFQFRNLPLTQIHVNAFSAARAAEAAGLQGQFWQMHDALYNNQNQWVPASDPTPFYNEYAQQLGLNLNQFKTDYSSDKVNNLINADLAAFNKTGLQEATPTFVLDGTQISPQPTADSFAQFIIAEIAKKQGKSATAPSSTSSPGTNQSVQPSSSTKH